MFTGIVEAIGTVKALHEEGESTVLTITGASRVLGDVHLGDSIAINGTCLTVTSFIADEFTVGVSPQTLRVTNLKDLKTGKRVNLERALLPSQRMGGHFVQGHVDGVCVILEKKKEKDSLWFTLSIPKGLEQYVVEKGYVALDGTSLTVCSVEDGEEGSKFKIMLVDYTQKHVVIPDKEVGESVNIEVDILGKYVARSRGFVKEQ